MARYRITLKDRSEEHVESADAYQQEGPMTTFFQTGSGRHVVDTWSTRVASFRTAEVIAIRRIDLAASAGSPAPGTGADRSATVSGLRSA